MGKIENSILENYRKNLSDGNISQAKRSVELAGFLKKMIEDNDFVDFEDTPKSQSTRIGTFYDPFPYEYDAKYGIVKIEKNIVNLTKSENKLFYLFSQNETFDTNIRIIRSHDIKSFIWPDRKVTKGAMRILIKRLRTKIEADPKKPQIILNYNNKGYIFVAKNQL